MVKIGAKNWFLTHFVSFNFVYAPLHPMSYSPRFCQMKDVIKIYIYGKFHQYSICGWKVENFQSFSYWLSLHEMVPFGVFLDSYSRKYCSILLKFWPEVFSNKKNTVIEKSFKILNFDSDGTHPWFTVLVHLGAQFTTRKPKILLKTKIFCINYILRNIE